MSKIYQVYSQKAGPTWSGLLARFNDPYLFAVVLFCLFCLISLLLTASRLGGNESYVAAQPDGVVSAPTGKVGPLKV